MNIQISFYKMKILNADFVCILLTELCSLSHLGSCTCDSNCNEDIWLPRQSTDSSMNSQLSKHVDIGKYSQGNFSSSKCCNPTRQANEGPMLAQCKFVHQPIIGYF